MRLFLAMATPPSSGSSSPVRIRKRVDLPAPLRPRRPTRSPVSIWKVMPSRMLFPISKDFFTLLTLISIIVDTYFLCRAPRGMASRFDLTARDLRGPRLEGDTCRRSERILP